MNKLPIKKMTSIDECYNIIMDLHKKFYKEFQRNLTTELFISCFGFPIVKESKFSIPKPMKVELVGYYQNKNEEEIEWLISNA